VERHGTTGTSRGLSASDNHGTTVGGIRALPGSHADTATDTRGATGSDYNIATSARVGLADLQGEIT
jgi:hypothetical protein